MSDVDVLKHVIPIHIDLQGSPLFQVIRLFDGSMKLVLIACKAATAKASRGIIQNSIEERRRKMVPCSIYATPNTWKIKQIPSKVEKYAKEEYNLNYKYHHLTLGWVGYCRSSK